MKMLTWKLLSGEEKKILLKRPVLKNKDDVAIKVKAIIQQIKSEGNKACLALTNKYDGVMLDNIAVSEEELNAAPQMVEKNALQAMRQVIAHLTTFHLPQKLNAYQVETCPGVICESQPRPLQRIGIYVPGGSAPLVSTVLMLGVPAQIAGCKTRILCTPPDKNGNINPNILVAAGLCGIRQIYKLGGAQAIAAMAYGTETIPKVDKIMGPGNAWVVEAKIQVAQDAEGAQYDSPAGPSEVMVIADANANAEFVAADLLSQAEHGIDSQTILLCTDPRLIKQIMLEIKNQQNTLARKKILEKSLENGRFLLVDTIDEAINIANDYAPEHLILQIDQPRKYLEKINNVGSVFLGQWSPESAGDYASGTNHVLPTYGYAKSLSGLTVRDFMKTISVQELSRDGLQNIAETIKTLTTIEGLDGHQNAVNVRLRGTYNAK